MRRFSLIVTTETEIGQLLACVHAWQQEPTQVDIWAMSGTKDILDLSPKAFNHNRRHYVPAIAVHNGQSAYSRGTARTVYSSAPVMHYLPEISLTWVLAKASLFADALVMTQIGWLSQIGRYPASELSRLHAPLLIVASPAPPERICTAAQIDLVKVIMQFPHLRQLSWLVYDDQNSTGENTKQIMNYLGSYTDQVSYLQLGEDCRARLENILPEHSMLVLPESWELPCGTSAAGMVAAAAAKDTSFMLVPRNRAVSC